MEVDECGAAAASTASGMDSKEDIKPLLDADGKLKSETKPVVPEPLMPNAGDKKKKCGK